MKDKWTTNELPRPSDGQPVVQSIRMIDDAPYPTYKPKTLAKSPSIRAMRNYYNLSVESNSFDNFTFLPENGDATVARYDDAFAVSPKSIYGDNYMLDPYFSDTLRSLSPQTTVSGPSEIGSVKDMGSTAKLVSPKLEMSCQTWLSYIQTVICTIALSAGLGNLYRLPQTALLNGGISFVIVYLILVFVIGLPILFLEIGIGQLAEEGFVKMWRVVPFFRGIGYVKLLANFLLSLYYPLYIGMAVYYVIWMAKSQAPFCATVKMTSEGYSTIAKDGQESLKTTFLKSAFVDPSWYGIYASLLLAIWAVIIVLSIRRTKSFTRSLILLIFPVIGCFIALIVKAALSDDINEGFNQLISHVSWDDLLSSKVWYYAALQVFFSTNIGFGTFITNAGIMYNKLNPLCTALGYITSNLIFGLGTILLCYVISGTMTVLPKKKEDIAELHLMTLIYDLAASSSNFNEAKIWAIVAYCLIILTGFISMATISYSLLKAVTVELKKKLTWWKSSLIFCFLGFIMSCGILLKENFQLVRWLDVYVVGNLIFVSVILEVFALTTFYGPEKIKCDFEFMLGRILSKFWLISWWIAPLLLTGLFCWGIVTLPFGNDPEWLSASGWSVILAATLFIFILGLCIIFRQDAYSFTDKMKIAFKPTKDWGPKDPMLRYAWVQWCSKIKQGERDFTLKRRGTRDYTRSIKKESKKKIAQTAINLSNNFNTLEKTDKENNLTNNNKNLTRNDSEIIYQKNDFVPSMTNEIEKEFNTNNALNDSNLDQYGTFRNKGPYIINDGIVGHVCYRRYSEYEDATEL